jgi:XTP/dITP diphosphohydrolase
LGGLGIELVSQRELGVSDAEETGLSFVENALLKARHACATTGLPAIADDSGIEVDALNGEPGIYSARFAGVSGETREVADAANNELLLERLAGLKGSERSARFQCIIVYLRHAADPTPLICQGTWEGQILESAAGANGFGYDPLFYVPTHDCASAALTPEIKNTLSHRGQALEQLRQCWQNPR